MPFVATRLLAVFLAAGSSPPAQVSTDAPAAKSDDEPVDAIVALVNEHIITRRDILQRIGPALKALADPDKARNLWLSEEYRIVMEWVELDAAKQLGLRVEPKAVDRRLKQDIERAGGKDTFQNFLAQSGQTEQQYREELENELKRVQLYTSTTGLFPSSDKKSRPEVDIEPTVAEIRAYYNAHLAEFTVLARAHVRQIYLRDASFQTPAEARARMDALRERILKGESFADLAKAESHDPATRESGGDLGWILLEGSSFKKFLTDFAATAPPGSLSEIERQPLGWYLFKLEERTDKRLIPFEEVQEKSEEKDRPGLVERIRTEKFSTHLARIREKLIRDAKIWAPDLPDLKAR